MPIRVVPHYRPCLLEWYLSISHACWCDAILQAMPSGPRLLQPIFILDECRWKKDGYQSGANLTGVRLHQTSADHVSLSDMSACTVQL